MMNDLPVDRLDAVFCEIIRQARDRLAGEGVSHEEEIMRLCNAAVLRPRLQGGPDHVSPSIARLKTEWRRRIPRMSTLVWLSLDDMDAVLAAAQKPDVRARFEAAARFLRRAATERELPCDCPCLSDCGHEDSCYCPCGEHEAEAFEAHCADAAVFY